MILRRGAQRDSLNLRYYQEDINACLLELTEENFHKTETYKNQHARSKTCDIYLIKHKGPSGQVDDLYVKFTFTGWIVVHSFHLQRQ